MALLWLQGWRTGKPWSHTAGKLCPEVKTAWMSEVCLDNAQHLSRVYSIQARSKCLALQHKVSENLEVQSPKREVPHDLRCHQMCLTLRP